jgi:pyridoxine kinase
MGRVIVISSHVVRGQVGLSATVPALQRHGHETWALPTVLFANRPGLGRLVRRELPEADMTALLGALEADGCWASLDAVLTGYFPSAASVTVAARAIAAIQKANPRAVVLVDPIMGDAGRLYVPREVAEAVRDELIPLAGISTPNLFELAWLSGDPELREIEAIEWAARRLGPHAVVVTSAREEPERLTTLLVTPAASVARDTPRLQSIPNGAGDLFAGLFLGALLNGSGPEPALDASLADLGRVLSASIGRPVLQIGELREGP